MDLLQLSHHGDGYRGDNEGKRGEEEKKHAAEKKEGKRGTHTETEFSVSESRMQRLHTDIPQKENCEHD